MQIHKPLLLLALAGTFAQAASAAPTEKRIVGKSCSTTRAQNLILQKSTGKAPFDCGRTEDTFDGGWADHSPEFHNGMFDRVKVTLSLYACTRPVTPLELWSTPLERVM